MLDWIQLQVHQRQQLFKIAAADLLCTIPERQLFVTEDYVRFFRVVNDLRGEHRCEIVDVDHLRAVQDILQEISGSVAGNALIAVARNVQPDNLVRLQVNGKQVCKGALAIDRKG